MLVYSAALAKFSSVLTQPASRLSKCPYASIAGYKTATMRCLSKSCAEHGIMVNAVSPAFIATPMTDAMMQKRAKENGTGFDETVASFLKEERPTLGLQRRGHADEVAAAVVFLCSKQASFITGINMRVDGGSVTTV